LGQRDVAERDVLVLAATEAVAALHLDMRIDRNILARPRIARQAAPRSFAGALRHALRVLALDIGLAVIAVMFV